MTRSTNVWTREAVLERLAASDAIDVARRVDARTRAERRVELFDVVTDVEWARIDASAAALAFRAIRDAVESAERSDSANASPTKGNTND